MKIRHATPGDAASWQRLRTGLWPEVPTEAHALHAARFFWSSDRDTACLVAEWEGVVVGFLEVSVCEEREGEGYGAGICHVGHVDGWYVAPEWRGSGVGRALMREGEAWARARRCRAVASDTAVEDVAGHGAYAALGFTPVRRVVRWRRLLEPGPSGATRT
jgi:aminoglycoside 6'-N-acetyltransferase I